MLLGMPKKFLLKILQWFLKNLAKLTISKYEPAVIGVTGNTGKTSTKEAIRLVLASAGRRVRSSLKNFNNELGLPLGIIGDWDNTEGVLFWPKVLITAVFQLLFKRKTYPEILILEYGVDKPGDMKYLLDIAKPTIGLITAIGEVPVHVENFAGPEDIIREKVKLIRELPATGFAILNADDPVVLGLEDETRGHVITFGFGENAGFRISNFQRNFDGERGGINFKFSYGGSSVPVYIPGALGKSTAYCAAAAAVVGLIFGFNLVRLADALRGYESPAGRQKIIPGIKKSVIIDDTYNASPLAMREALETLRSLSVKRKIAVLGDMLEIGKYTIPAHEAVGRIIPKAANVLITVGTRGKIIAEAARKQGMSVKSIFIFDDVEKAGLFLQSLITKNDLILVKASQGVRLEKVVKEVMAGPDKAEELLVRQTKSWLSKPGMYDPSDNE